MKMKTTAAFAVLAGLLLAASAAWAQPEPAPVYQLKTHIKFTEITIEGTVVKPPVDVINVRTPPKFDRLFKPRADFHAELQRSTDGL